MPKSKKIITPLPIRVSLLLLFLFLQACQKDILRPDSALVVANSAEPATLDLHLATGQPELRVIGALFEGLVLRGLQDEGVRPGMAHSWEVSEDGKTYTFHLRRSEWSDGTPLTSQDFLRSWRRFADPATASEYASLLKMVRNATAVRERRMPPDSLGVFTPNDTTFIVELEYPVAFFLDLCAFEPFFPVPLDTILKHREKWTSPAHITGNGPFVLRSWRRNVEMVLEKNPRYWDAANVRQPALIIKPVEDQLTAFNMFTTKELDWIFNVPPSRLEAAQQMPEYFSHPMFGTYYYIVNCKNPGYDSRDLRKALSLAIDREIIVKKVQKGIPSVATGFVPPLPGYTGPGLELHNPDLAREYLAKSGFGPENPPPRLQILFNTSESHKDIAEVIRQMWRQVLGLDAELINYEWKVYLENTKNLNYASLARAGWIGDFQDPITFLELATSDDGNNRSGFSNPEYDRLIAETWTLTDPRARLDKLLEAERLLMDEMPVIPIYYNALTEMRSPRLRNAHPNPLGMYSWKDIYLEP